MLRFLEGHFEWTDSDELAALLGGLVLTEDGRPMDPAAWDDRLAAIDQAIGGPA